MPRETTGPCPRCRSLDTLHIAYGFPSPKLFEAADRGEVVLGGCIVGRPGGDPDRRCTECGHEWITAGAASPRTEIDQRHG